MIDDSYSLRGRRVVITRAPEQSQELLTRLVARGAEVLVLPMVRFLDARDTSGMDRAIAELSQFDWVIFTSSNAVRFFLGRCRALGRSVSGPWPKIAAVGPATQAALEGEKLHAALVPKKFDGAALVAELAGELPGMNVLLPRSDRASVKLPAGLRAAGARVTEVIAYRTTNAKDAQPEPSNLPEPSESSITFDAEVVGVLRRGDADAVTFFSPSAFHNFEKMFGAEASRKMGGRMAFAAVGSVTAAAIRNAGVPLAVEATEATTDSLVAALERHFALQAGRQRTL